jgi:esterase/lipase superfamily enzyme
VIYLVSNRDINCKSSNKKSKVQVFGDKFNSSGQDVLRFAQVSDDPSGWRLDLFDEVDGEQDPSQEILEKLYSDGKPCVVFIHGFNQSLKKNIKKSLEIEKFGVNVLAFSWPSNPGPNFIALKIIEYKRACKNARRSTFALERFFDMLLAFVEEKGTNNTFKTLAIHSLGNYLTEDFINGLGFENQTALFKNILFHQADVNSVGHESWIDKLGENNRITITMNETDNVLDASDIISPDRLGNTIANLNSKYAKYYDFTNAEGAEDVHRLWTISKEKNPNINTFFESVFRGKIIKREGMVFNQALNCYEIA